MPVFVSLAIKPDNLELATFLPVLSSRISDCPPQTRLFPSESRLCRGIWISQCSPFGWVTSQSLTLGVLPRGNHGHG